MQLRRTDDANVKDGEWGEEVAVGEEEEEEDYEGDVDFGAREGVMRPATGDTALEFDWKSALHKAGVSGVGFLSDAYDLFVINIVLLILSVTHGISAADKGWISSAVLVGALFGQIGFGFIADKIGRKKGFVATLSLVILGTLASALAFPVGPISIAAVLAVLRFVLGIGIGGEYPLSATITAESAETSSRGRLTAAVFSMQGVGALTAAVVSWAALQLLSDLDLAWRVCIAFGAVPGLLTFYFRLTMHETQRFEIAAAQGGGAPAASRWALLRRYWRRLVGTAGTWFLLDITFYANGLFSAQVLEMSGIGGSGSKSGQPPTLDELITISRFNIILALAAVPGYWTAVYLIETRLGRKSLQVLGFLLMAILYCVMAVAFEGIKSMYGVFVTLYALSFFFTNAGPNTTTYVLAAESFPTEVRATLHGISAAAGKLGAALGAVVMANVLEAWGLRVVFLVCGVVASLGAVVTIACIDETVGKSLEQINAPPVEIELQQFSSVPTHIIGSDDDDDDQL